MRLALLATTTLVNSAKSPVYNQLTPAVLQFRAFSISSKMSAQNGSSPVVNGSKPLDILVIGLGSIGAVYSHILERTGKARVTAVARSNYDAYVKGQVTLDTDKFGKLKGWKPHRVVKSQAEALEGEVEYDYCLITTKCLPDVLPTPTLVEDAIKSRKVKAWSLIQNGLGVEEDLYQALKDQDTPIISSCAWIGIMTSQDGLTTTWRGQDHLVSGIYPPLAPVDRPQDRSHSEKEKAALATWCELLKAGGASVNPDDRIDAVRFGKNIWNCSWSSVQGLVRGTPETFESFTEEERAPLKAFMREVVETGFAAGLMREGDIQYPMGDKVLSAEKTAEVAWERIYNMSIDKIKQGLSPHKMSLLIDVEYGRPFEVEVITGAVLRLAKQNGLDTPHLALVYSLLKGLQRNILKQRAAKA